MVSAVLFLPKLLAISTQITGNIIRLTIGMNNRKTHHHGLFMILKSTIAL
jgi:hypothetical protein